MHRPAVLFALGIALGLAACTGSTEPAPGALLGRWATSPEAHSPSGSYQSALTFQANGRFASEVRMFGVYGGQRAGDLSSWSRIVGTYGVDGDRLTFVPDSLIWWDRFYGPDPTPNVQAPAPYTSLYDDTRFSIAGSVLTLRYTIYPADAPVATTRRFHRAD